VVEDGRSGHVGALGDLVHRRRVITLDEEARDGSVEDPLAQLARSASTPISADRSFRGGRCLSLLVYGSQSMGRRGYR
jgi:hypothetical protein